jgi:hypothetical protein
MQLVMLADRGRSRTSILPSLIFLCKYGTCLILGSFLGCAFVCYCFNCHGRISSQIIHRYLHSNTWIYSHQHTVLSCTSNVLLCAYCQNKQQSTLIAVWTVLSLKAQRKSVTMPWSRFLSSWDISYSSIKSLSVAWECVRLSYAAYQCSAM